MRYVATISLALLAGCTVQSAPDNMTAQVVAVQVPGNEPATSAAARQAKQVVENYYRLIGDKKYSAARALWADNGAASGGDDAAFAATFALYSQYRPKVGDPTEIKSVGGLQYVSVGAAIHVKNRKSGAEADRTGAVMLRRSADTSADAAARQWRIWGIDIRARH